MSLVARTVCRPLCITLAALALALAGCAGTPTQFYTLLPASRVEALPAQDPAFQIQVATVDIPAQVDVQMIVVRQGNGTLTPVETRRWIAPLGSEIRSALIAALTHELGVAEVSGVTPDEQLPLYRIQASVRRFDSALGSAAQIEAVWTVRSAKDTRLVATCYSRISVPVAPGYEALAEGHQRAIGQLADAIAQATLALQSGRATSACAAATSSP